MVGARSTLWLACATIVTKAFRFFGDVQGKIPDRCTPYETIVEGEVLGPELFLIMTSPAEKKVVYTEVIDVDKALGSQVYALIDNDLAMPKGIAWDRKRGRLYVSDIEKRDIKQYEIVVEVDKNKKKSIRTKSSPKTIVINTHATWIRVDPAGNLFYTDDEKNSVQKVEENVIKEIMLGEITADMLKKTTELSLYMEQQQQMLNEDPETKGLAPIRPPEIVEMADQSTTPFIQKPMGIATDGQMVYWGNGEPLGSWLDAPYANSYASIVGIPADTPMVDSQTAAKRLTNAAPEVHGVEIDALSVFFTFNNTVAKVPQTNKIAPDNSNLANATWTILSDSFQQPRGLAWDLDGTLYVADAALGKVTALPTSADHTVVAPREVVKIDGVFDLVVLTCMDDGLDIVKKKDYTQETNSGRYTSVWDLFR